MSFLVLLMTEVAGFLCVSLNIVIFVALDICNNNRCDSVVSQFDTICISRGLGHVRYSPIPSQILSILTVLQVILAN